MTPKVQSRIGILLLAMWVSYGIYLYPWPWDRVSELSPAPNAASMPWLSGDIAANINTFWKSLPTQIWIEWLGTLGITVAGIVLAIGVIRKAKFVLALSAILSVVFMAAWVGKYTHTPASSIVGVPERSLIDTLLEKWAAVRYLDSNLQYGLFFYYDLMLPLLHLCVIALVIYWYTSSWLMSRRG